MQGKRTLKTERFGETSYAVATPDQRERPKEEEEEDLYRAQLDNVHW